MSDNPNIPNSIISRDLVKETQSLNPSAIIEIIQLDLTELKFKNKKLDTDIADYYYFHNSPIYGNSVIEWGSSTIPNGLGIIYVYPLPFEITGITQTNTELPRPIFRISNHKEYLSYLMLQLGDLRGAKIIKHKTLVKYLNNRRVRYQDEIYFINKKNKENREEIEFELCSPLELEGDKIPRRQIIGDYCSWEYRNVGCLYASFPVCDKNMKFFESSKTPNGYASYGFDDWSLTDGLDKGEWTKSSSYSYREYVTLTYQERKRVFVCINLDGAPANTSIFNETYWMPDACLKKLSDCKYHYGDGSILPYGGFPAINQYNYDPSTMDLS